MTDIQSELNAYRGRYFEGEWPTIYQMFAISLSRFPSRPCFTVFEPNRKTYTYSDVDKHIKAIAAKLIEAGVQPGEKVVINGKNSVQWGMAYLAVNYIGAVVVPIDNQLKTERVCALAQFADAVYIIADFDVITKIPADNEWFKSIKGMMTLKGHIEGTENVLEAESSKVYPCASTDCEALAAILFTSGTTGNEKGAMMSNKNIVSDVWAAAANMDVNENDVLYALLPLHHSYSCNSLCNRNGQQQVPHLRCRSSFSGGVQAVPADGS